MSKRFYTALCLLLATTQPLPVSAAADDTRSLEELRDTVVNLLDALVEKGVVTREQAQAMVARAQAKADEAAKARDAARKQQEEEEKGAVRVPYVPQIVKDEISRQVAEQVKPQVVASVVEEAKAERWGVPAALPDWLSRARVFGDVRFRYENDYYPSGNIPGYWLDYNSINSAGGIPKAGLAEFLNVTENWRRLRIRARLGAELDLGWGWSAGLRVASGAPTDPDSESQTLGTYGAHYTVGLDSVYVRFQPTTASHFPWLSATGGRMVNPWFSPTDLMWGKDLTLEGTATTWRVPFGGGGPQQSHAFATVGAFPIQFVPLVTKGNKYLAGAQLGTSLRWDGGQTFTLAASYYDFLRVTGIRNPQDLTVDNYSAPGFIRFGNTQFDISNSTTDQTINLFALAAKFRVADASLRYEVPVSRYVATFSADALRNLAFNATDILYRTGQLVDKRNKGYQGEFAFGFPTVTEPGHWRVLAGYRYLEGDATIDAFTDPDFHNGGTNTRGPYFLGSVGVGHSIWLQLKYMSADVIDGPKYSLDILQLDVNAQF